jgi:ribonuclease J
MVSITVHGGAGEIGGNKILVEDGDRRVFLDFGMSFGKIGDFYEDFLQPRTNSGLRDLLALGILPKIDGIYRDDLLELDHLRETLDDLGVADSSLWAAEVKSYKDIKERDGRPAVDGVIVSHAHMDHFQHISMLDEEIPVFCSETTKAVIEAAEDLSADRFGTDVINIKRRSIAKQGKSAYFPDTPKVNSECIPRPVNAVCPEKAFAVGAMEAELHPVDHSVPGATAVVLKTGGKRIVYTGDLRFHGLAGDLTRRFRDELAGSRPDVLIAEGTRIEKDTPDSEAGVLEECARLVSQAGPALAMVGFAWKDTTRYRTMMEVARETGRTLVVSAKLAYLTNKLSSLPDAPVRPVCDEPDVKVYLKRKGSMLYSMSDYVGTKYDLGYSADWDKKDCSTIDTQHYECGVRAYDIAADPGRYLLHLDFFELNELIDLRPPPGSVYVSAVSEPFNMEMELDRDRLRHWLQRFGVNPPGFEPIYAHASGHASGPEVLDMIRQINPKVLIPVHTEHPELFVRGLVGSDIVVRVPTVGQPVVLR